MSDLRDFVLEHTARNACRCGSCVHDNVEKKPSGHTVDMFFFDVCMIGAPEPQRFRDLIAAHQAPWEDRDMNPLDGKEHGYIEFGGWIGDQSEGMQCMALGKLLGLWDILQPAMIMPRESPVAQQMAGMGMITAVPKGRANGSPDRDQV